MPSLRSMPPRGPVGLLCPVLALVLLGCLRQAAALAIFGWNEPRGLDHEAALDERDLSIYALVPSLETIFSTGDVTKRKTAGFGFNFQIDYLHSLWGFCPTTVAALEDCLIAHCVDKFECSTGCGIATPNSYLSITCTRSNAAFCSTAFLTPQTRLPGATYMTCGADDTYETYMGFTIDLLPTDSSTASKSSTLPSSTTSTSQTASASPQARSSGTTITSGPAAADVPSNTASPSDSSKLDSNQAGSEGANSGGGAGSGSASNNNNIGPIIGGVVGCVALLGGFGIAAVVLLRRNRNAASASSSAAKAASLSSESGPPHDGGGLPETKPELEAWGRSELSARGPAAYDTASHRPNYPPMTPVELPVVNGAWL